MRHRFACVLAAVIVVCLVAGVFAWPYVTGGRHTINNVIQFARCENTDQPDCS